MIVRRVAVFVAAVPLAVTALVAGPATASTTAGITNTTYVAMGDSYAAGYGLPHPAMLTGQPVPGCAQTSLDYPHLVATALHEQLTDVSCSGAVTADFTHHQQTADGTAPPQLKAVKRMHPGLVTVTIGGNDLGFSTIAGDCLAASPTGPLVEHPSFANCQSYYNSTGAGGGKSNNPFDKLPAVETAVQDAVHAVVAAAPQAKVIVVAYPAIAPDAAHTPAGGCFAAEAGQGGGIFPSALPFTDADVPYLQLLQAQLDAALRTAASAAGADFSTIYLQSLAHSACSPEPARWVEPFVPGGGGTNSLHPSLAGERELAAGALRTFTYP